MEHPTDSNNLKKKIVKSTSMFKLLFFFRLSFLMIMTFIIILLNISHKHFWTMLIYRVFFFFLLLDTQIIEKYALSEREQREEAILRIYKSEQNASLNFHLFLRYTLKTNFEFNSIDLCFLSGLIQNKYIFSQDKKLFKQIK